MPPTRRCCAGSVTACVKTSRCSEAWTASQSSILHLHMGSTLGVNWVLMLTGLVGGMGAVNRMQCCLHAKSFLSSCAHVCRLEAVRNVACSRRTVCLPRGRAHVLYS